MLAGKYRYVVVEGPIGAGKTSLARRLAERASAHLLLEQPDENPFLARFYRDSARYALPAQMFFLFQRVQQLAELKQLDLFRSAIVSDFLLEKDRLFARLTLADDELRLYEQMHDQMKPATVAPDLVVYLQARPETLVERVGRRGVVLVEEPRVAVGERAQVGLGDARLDRIAAPVLIVNTEHLNLVDRDEDFDLLLDRIGKLRGRREYFNLAA
jgi:deoxyguanosine kinase